MSNIIQLGLDHNDDYALTELNGKWVKIPLWVWAEWELPDGIQGIINEWQHGLLINYGDGGIDNYMGFRGFLAVEHEALTSIQKQAVMIKRHIAGKRIAGLTDLERKVLDLERACMLESPHMKGVFVREWIADRMTRMTHSHFTENQIKAILDDCSYVMKGYYDLMLQEKMAATLKVLGEVWLEAANDNAAAA